MFGTALFDRTQRQIRLTEAGQRLRVHARKILDNAQEARQAMHDSVCGRLAVSCGPAGQYTVLPNMLRQLRMHHPTLELTIQTLTPTEIKNAAASGTVDLLLMTPDWHLPGMEFLSLRTETLSAVLPEDHPAGLRGWISLKEFCQSLVLVSGNKDCHKHRKFVTALIESYDLTAELVDSPGTGDIQYAMIAAGCGVAFAESSLSRANIPGVKIVPFDHVIHTMDLGMMWHRRNESQALVTFREVVKEIVSQQNEKSNSFDYARVPIEQKLRETRISLVKT
jgi:DNA-binding transcriptional LysR family regulator